MGLKRQLWMVICVVIVDQVILGKLSFLAGNRPHLIFNGTESSTPVWYQGSFYGFLGTFLIFAVT